jgi:DNA-binding ferritin-like protein
MEEKLVQQEQKELNAEKVIAELTSKVDLLSTQLKENMKFNNTEADVASKKIKAELELKDKKLHESEQKTSTLTEKLKEIMHRYADLKAKSSAQLQTAEEKIADLLHNCQAKVQKVNCETFRCFCFFFVSFIYLSPFSSIFN